MPNRLSPYPPQCLECDFSRFCLKKPYIVKNVTTVVAITTYPCTLAFSYASSYVCTKVAHSNQKTQLFTEKDSVSRYVISRKAIRIHTVEKNVIAFHDMRVEI